MLEAERRDSLTAVKLSILSALLLGSVGGGIAGGALVLTLNASESEPKAEAERSAKEKSRPKLEAEEDDEDVDNPLSGRVKSLERRVSLLTLAAERGGTAFAKGDAGADSDEDLSMADVADPVFEAAVLDIFERERERKEEERETWRAELRTKRSTRFASELGERLQIGTAEQERIAQVVSDYFQALQEMRGGSAEERPATRKEWRERMDGLRQKADESLGEILDADQMKAYQALDDDEKIGFGRGRGRRAGGNAD